jgi:hypothetical protein
MDMEGCCGGEHSLKAKSPAFLWYKRRMEKRKVHDLMGCALFRFRSEEKPDEH